VGFARIGWVENPPILNNHLRWVLLPTLRELNYVMLLKQVKLTHFRCFNQLEINLHPHLTVFVGNNGAGKTAILDGIAIGLGPILTHLPRVSGTRLKESDLKIKDEKALFVRVQMETVNLVWDITKKRDNSQKTIAAIPKPKGIKQLREFLDIFIDDLNENKPTTLPVFVYYDTNRVAPETTALKPHLPQDGSRFKALNNALQSNSQFKEILEWFYAMEFEELKIKQAHQDLSYRLPALEAIRQAITTMIPEISNPHISTNPPYFMVSWHHNGRNLDLRLEQLSDGYRLMLILVMDLARRLAQANPHLKEPLQSEAIVLIDEVDLHLHPKWQQTVLLDLQRTFPNTQFIVTTHSPQVLTTVNKENILILENGTLYEQLTNTYGAESVRLLEEVMNVSSRPENLEEVQKLSQYLELVNQGDYATEQAYILRGELEKTFRGGDSTLDLADMVIRRHKALAM